MIRRSPRTSCVKGKKFGAALECTGLNQRFASAGLLARKWGYQPVKVWFLNSGAAPTVACEECASGIDTLVTFLSEADLVSG